MASLLTELRKQALGRGYDVPEQPGPGDAFRLVREMPYLRASDRQPGTTIREWRGTCSGKHYLLQALLAELGIESRLIAAPCYVAIDPAGLPSNLAGILAEGPVPDVHNYLRLPWIVDATWPLAAAEYGVPVNPDWTEGQDMLLPCTPLAELEVPGDGNAQDYKDRLLAGYFTPEELARRDRFFGELAGN